MVLVIRSVALLCKASTSVYGTCSASLGPRRSFWRWLIPVFNRYSEKEILEVGGELAAARWIVRNGGAVKWAGNKHFTKDYNALPTGPTGKHVVQAIDATDSSISVSGFAHLKHLGGLRMLKLVRCDYVCDKCLESLGPVKDTLEHLDVVSCGSVTEPGVLSLQILHKLKTLYLYNLSYVQDRKTCLYSLQMALPQTKISFEPTDNDAPVKHVENRPEGFPKF